MDSKMSFFRDSYIAGVGLALGAVSVMAAVQIVQRLFILVSF